VRIREVEGRRTGGILALTMSSRAVRSLVRVVVGLACAAAVFPWARAATEQPPVIIDAGVASARATESPTTLARRVLVYTTSAGFEHDVVKRPKPEEPSLVERALVEMGRSSGAFEAVVSRDPAAFDAASLATFDAVLFYTTGELPLSAPQRQALLAFVRDGGGFVGVHCATDTFYEVPEYGRMIGAYFDGHPWHEKVAVRVEQRAHAATAHLEPRFEIVDEIYQFRAPYDRASLRVLMSLDRGGVDGRALDTAREGVHRTDGDFALAWTKPFGRGRVFYTALGHRPEVWSDTRFTRHLLGGLRWSMRDETRPKLDERDEALRARVTAEVTSKRASGSGDSKASGDASASNGHDATSSTVAKSVVVTPPPGDPRRGFEVFRRESGPMCARCHMVNGQGGTVGPDLSAVARRLTREELIDAVLAPSDSILSGYEAVSLELKDSTVAFGRIVSEVDGTITLAETTGTTRAIRVEDVAARNVSTVSVMPNGLAATLMPEEFSQLIAYLSTLNVSPGK